MEKDDEVKGDGNSIDFGERMLDTRVGRWFVLDPLAKKFPYESNYTSHGNNPNIFIDIHGEEIIIKTTGGNTFVYKPGMKLPDDEFARKAVKALNEIHSTKKGQAVVETLVGSYNTYKIREAKSLTTGDKTAFSLGLNSEYDSKYSKLINEGKYSEAQRLLKQVDAGEVKVFAGDYVSNWDINRYDNVNMNFTITLAHELYHAFTFDRGKDNGEFGPSLLASSEELGGVDFNHIETLGFENYIRASLYKDTKYYQTRASYTWIKINSYFEEPDWWDYLLGFDKYEPNEFIEGGKLYDFWNEDIQKRLKDFSKKLYNEENDKKNPDN